MPLRERILWILKRQAVEGLNDNNMGFGDRQVCILLLA